VASNVKESKPIFSAPVIVVILLLAAGGAAVWYLQRDTGPPQVTALTPEARTYVRNLALSDVEMRATENAIKQAVVEITGKITNNGDRPLQSVAINCVFHDTYGQLALRERVEIVKGRQGGLKPGETKTFRLPFDNLPKSWNQSMPQLVIASIVFG
jgi:Protein of unknown function (DUF3426)